MVDQGLDEIYLWVARQTHAVVVVHDIAPGDKAAVVVVGVIVEGDIAPGDRTVV